MTRVITSACIDTKAAACVQACPVDCIHPKPGVVETKTLTGTRF